MRQKRPTRVAQRFPSAKRDRARALAVKVSVAILAALAAVFSLQLRPAAAASTGFSLNASRFAGIDRYDTSARLADAAFPQGARSVVLASGANWPDALTGQFLAANLGAPVLLTTPALPLSPFTTAALTTLGAKRVYLLGGPSAVSAAEERALSAAGYAITRIYDSDGCGSGCTRYDTMAAADQVPGADAVGQGAEGAPTAIVATGDDFADAVSAGPLSYARRFPIVLTDGRANELLPQARAVLLGLGIKDVIVMGGTDAISSGIVADLVSLGITVDYRAAGADRTQTALDLASYEATHYGFSDTAFDLATGAGFADALSGAAFGALDPVPTLLIEADGSLGPYLGAFLEHGSGRLTGGYALGGPAALAPALLDEISTAEAAGPPSITTTALPAGALGQLYRAVPSAAGGVPPYTWSVSSGLLPPGLGLDPATGTISGLPTKVGVTSFGLQVTDADGGSAQATLSITIAALAAVSPGPGPSSGSGSGGLEVVVGSVPPGLTPDVVVTGPGGYRAAVSATETLTALAPGSYAVSVASDQTQVAGVGTTWYSEVVGSPAEVTAGQTAEAEVSWSEVLDTTHAVTSTDASDMTIGTCNLPSGATGTSVGFDPVPSDVADLVPGDILTVGVTSETPSGLVARIVSVSGSSVSPPMTFCTEAVELADAVPQGSLHLTGTLSPGCVKNGSLPSGSPGTGFVLTGSGTSCSYDPLGGGRFLRFPTRTAPSTLHPGTAGMSLSPRAGPDDPLGGFTGSIGTGTQQGTEPGFSCGAAPPIAITGGFSFTPSASFTASWGLTSGLNASASASVTEQLHLDLTAQALASCNAQIPLLSEPIDYDCFDVQVGPVPVFVCPDLQLYLDVSVTGDVGVPLTESFTQQATVSAGLSISCGPTGCGPPAPQSSYTNTFTATEAGPPESSVDIKVAVGPELEFLIYDAGGPEVDLAGFGELSINPTAYLNNQPWWTLAGGLEAGAGVTLNLGGEIPVASINDPSILSASTVVAQAPSTSPPPPPVPTASVPGQSSTTLPSGTVGVGYTAVLSATGGAPPYTWSVSSLPPGLSLANVSIGGGPVQWEITGTPTKEGSFTVPVTLTDQIASVPGHTVTQSDTIDISGPKINNVTLAAAEVGLNYGDLLTATGGVCPQGSSSPCLSWSVSPSLPDGLSLDASSGEISGTPAPDAVGTQSLTFTVTDGEGNSSQVSLTLAVYAPPAIYDNGIGLGTAVPPHAEAGVAYEASVAVDPFSGDGPYTWSMLGGPSWLQLSCPKGASTCPTVSLVGTPSAQGSSSFRVQVVDVLGGLATESFTVEVLQGVVITTYSLPQADSAVAYSAQVTAEGGEQPYTWSATGLPAGLSLDSLDPSTGQITGTPPSVTTAEDYAATLTVSDSAGGTDSLPLVVTVNPLPRVTTTSLPDAPIGQPYGLGGFGVRLGESGGTAPFTWSIASGRLPLGLSLDPSSGTISGTIAPGAVDETFTVEVTDFWHQSASEQLTIIVPLGLTTPAGPLQDGYAGVPYTTPCGGSGTTMAVGAAGGAPPYRWTISSGSLPDGLTLDASTGQLTGTPTAGSLPSTSGFTVTVTDENGATESGDYTITVYPGTTIVSSVSPNVGGTAGGNQVTITGSGFCEPGVAVSFGTEPAASVTVVSDTEISVTTPPETAGQVQVAVTSDFGPAAGGPATEFTYMTTPRLVSVTMWSQYSTVSGLTLGDPFALDLTYNVPVIVTPGAMSDFTFPGIAPPPYVGVPACALDDWNEDLGTPDPYQTFGTHLIVYVYSDSCVSDVINTNSGLTSFLLSYAASAANPGVYNTYPSVYEPSGDAGQGAFPNGACGTGASPCAIQTTLGEQPDEVGVPITPAIAVADTPVPPDTWSVTGLPPGLAQGEPTYADSAPGCTGLCSTIPITGTPTATGGGGGTGGNVYDVQIGLEDYENTSGSGVSIKVPLTVEPTVSVATTSLPSATAGEAYSETLTASGGVGFDTWSVSSGSLPPGLSLDPFSGLIAGVPSHPVCECTYAFTVQVSDGYGVAATKALSISVAVSPLTIVTTSLPLATTGSSYAVPLLTSGGIPPYQWSLAQGSGPLPPGLSLDATSGLISGTPTSGGTYPITVQATDAEATPATATSELELSVSTGTLSVTTQSLPSGQAGVAYSATLAADGGVGPYTWSATGLPADLSLGASTGQITGTPSTGDVSASPYGVQVTVTDAIGETASATLSLTVSYAPLTITTTAASLGTPGACVGSSFPPLEATGGTGTYTWSLASGSAPMPPGLSLVPDGAISGSPTKAGSFPVTVEVTDSAGTSATKPLTLTVQATTLTIVTTALPEGFVEKPYSAALQASGGSDCSSYTWSATGLPADLSLGASTGQITGTPGSSDASASPFAVNVEVTDAASETANRALTLSVATVPSSPTNPAATTGTGSGVVEVSWAAPSSDGGAPVTGYDVYSGTSSGQEDYSQPACSAGANATTCTVSGLSPGATYYFTVEAVNGAGSSPPSTEVSAVASQCTTTTTAGPLVVEHPQSIGGGSCG